jgi:hypothetical protein
VVDKIRRFRNLIHPARALKESFNLQTFSHHQLIECKEMYDSVIHSVVCYLYSRPSPQVTGLGSFCMPRRAAAPIERLV